MGYKKTCFECRKSFNREFDSGKNSNYKCPDCGNDMKLMTHRFRPPKKTDSKSWKLVEFLADHGFYFQHITNTEDRSKFVPYPNNLKDAKEFVIKHANQAIKND